MIIIIAFESIFRLVFSIDVGLESSLADHIAQVFDGGIWVDQNVILVVNWGTSVNLDQSLKFELNRLQVFFLVVFHFLEWVNFNLFGFNWDLHFFNFGDFLFSLDFSFLFFFQLGLFFNRNIDFFQLFLEFQFLLFEFADLVGFDFLFLTFDGLGFHDVDSLFQDLSFIVPFQVKFGFIDFSVNELLGIFFEVLFDS